MTNDDLKPCPFCGKRAVLINVTKGYNYRNEALIDSFRVRCDGCLATTDSFESDIRINEEGKVLIKHNGAVEAIEAWNRRCKND